MLYIPQNLSRFSLLSLHYNHFQSDDGSGLGFALINLFKRSLL